MREGFVDRPADGHRGRAARPLGGDPAREQHARRARHWHAGDVATPPQGPGGVVIIQRADAEALQQLLGADAVDEHLLHCDPAHHADTPVVKDAQSLQVLLPQGPALAAVEQGPDDQSRKDKAFVLERWQVMFEEATLQCAKGCAGLDDASVDIRPTGELFVNQAAEVDELGAERNKPVPPKIF